MGRRAAPEWLCCDSVTELSRADLTGLGSLPWREGEYPNRSPEAA